VKARVGFIFAAALALSACDLGEFATGVSRALIEGERYVVRDDEVVWVSHPGMGGTPRRVEQRVDADGRTFVSAEDRIYGTDARSVFCRGRRLDGADPGGFRILRWPDGEAPNVATDGRRVWMNCDTVEGADGAGFRFLGGRYATDGTAVFLQSSRIAGADPSTFGIIDAGSELSRDAVAAWSGIFRIPTEAPEAIRPLGAGYATDGQAVYWRQFRVPGADPATFEVREDEMFGRDASGCWNGARAQACLTP